MIGGQYLRSPMIQQVSLVSTENQPQSYVRDLLHSFRVVSGKNWFLFISIQVLFTQ